MPHVDITMIPGRDDETKAAMARKVQRFLAEELGIEDKFVSVSVEDVPKERWSEHMTAYREEDLFVKPGV